MRRFLDGVFFTREPDHQESLELYETADRINNCQQLQQQSVIMPHMSLQLDTSDDGLSQQARSSEDRAVDLARAVHSETIEKGYRLTDIESDEELDSPTLDFEMSPNDVGFESAQEAMPESTPVAFRRTPSAELQVAIEDQPCPEDDPSADEASYSSDTPSTRTNKRRKTKAGFIVSQSDEEEPLPTNRVLRTRNEIQKTPYTANKYKHRLEMQKGVGLAPSDLEKALKKRKSSATPKPSKTAARSKSARGRSDSPTKPKNKVTATSPTPFLFEEAEDEFIQLNTTLRLTVRGQGAIEVPLSSIDGLGSLVQYINKRWGHVLNTYFNHIQCRRSWKGKEDVLTIYAGWEDQWQALMTSIRGAAAWRAKSIYERNLEVVMEVVLGPNKGAVERLRSTAPDEMSNSPMTSDNGE